MNGHNGPSALSPTVENPCAWLTRLRAAYYSLMSGQQMAEIWNNDQRMVFHRGDASKLQAEIQRLEIICEDGSAPRAAWPFRR